MDHYELNCDCCFPLDLVYFADLFANVVTFSFLK